jgi:hypothetical protein
MGIVRPAAGKKGEEKSPHNTEDSSPLPFLIPFLLMMTLECGIAVFSTGRTGKFPDVSGVFHPILCYSAPARKNQTTINEALPC